MAVLSVSGALGDRKRALTALSTVLAAQIDVCESSRDLAALSGRLQAVLLELDQLDATKKEGDVDDLASRRAARRAASTGS